MSAYSDLILFAVNLAVNLFLFGFFIAGGLALSFRLIENASPRLRYVITVAAFLIAAFIPSVVTLNGSLGLEQFIEIKQSGSNGSGGANSFAQDFVNQTFVVTPEIISFAFEPETEETSINSLNSFTFIVADSFIGTIFFALWILGSIYFFLRDILAYRHLRKARKLWRPATNSERKELAFPDGVTLYFGEESPAAVGLFSSSVVLPEYFPADTSPASKRYIIEHELAHARWRDPLINFILRVVRSLFWISPALWILERIADAERESAADFAAVTKCCINKSELKAAALNYATTLITIAKHFNSSGSSFNANAINLSGASTLENRVRRLLAHSSDKPAPPAVCLASMIFACSLFGLFFIPVAFQPKETSNRANAEIFNNEEPKQQINNENPSDLSSPDKQNKLSRVGGGISDENKEINIRADISNQNENKPARLSNGAKEIVQTQKIDIQVPEKQSANFNKDSENLARKLSERGAEVSAVQQKLEELSDKLQALALRRDSQNHDRQARERAPGNLDSTMTRAEPAEDSNRKSNRNINK